MKNFAAYVCNMLSKKAFINVLAEEPTETTTQTTEETQVEEKKEPDTTPETAKKQPDNSGNFETLISKAREEEKSKLYPQIEKLKKDKSDLLDTVDELKKDNAKLEKDLAKQKNLNDKISADLKDGSTTNKTVQELTLTISQLERQLEEVTVNHEKELTKIQLDRVKEQKIAEANGAIIPELVTGNSEEEITESVERAKARYAEITSSVANAQANKMPMSNPSFQNTQLSAAASLDDIATMSPKEYAEYRKKIGLK